MNFACTNNYAGKSWKELNTCGLAATGELHFSKTTPNNQFFNLFLYICELKCKYQNRKWKNY